MYFAAACLDKQHFASQLAALAEHISFRRGRRWRKTFRFGAGGAGGSHFASPRPAGGSHFASPRAALADHISLRRVQNLPAHTGWRLRNHWGGVGHAHSYSICTRRSAAGWCLRNHWEGCRARLLILDLHQVLCSRMTFTTSLTGGRGVQSTPGSRSGFALRALQPDGLCEPTDGQVGVAEYARFSYWICAACSAAGWSRNHRDGMHTGSATYTLQPTKPVGRVRGTFRSEVLA